MRARITGLLKKVFSNRTRRTRRTRMVHLGKASIRVGLHPGFLVPVELHPNQPDPHTAWEEGSTIRFTVLSDQLGPEWPDYMNLVDHEFYVSLIKDGIISKYQGRILTATGSVEIDDYLGMELSYKIEKILDYREIKEKNFGKTHFFSMLCSIAVALFVPLMATKITGSNAIGVACGIAMLQLYAGICRQIIVLSERDNAGQYKPISFWLFNFLLRSNVPSQPIGSLYERDWRGLVTLLRGASYFMGAGLLLALIAQNGGGALLGKLLPGS